MLDIRASRLAGNGKTCDDDRVRRNPSSFFIVKVNKIVELFARVKVC